MPASSNPLSSFVAFFRLGWFLLGGVAFLPRALRTALLFPIRTIQVFVVTAHFARLIASTMLEHARDLAPPSVNLHACAGLVACRISCSQLSGRSFGESLVLQPLPQI